MDIAQWLNTTFADFDLNIFQWFQSNFHETSAENIFDVFFRSITALANNGIFLIILALFLLVFKKTRKIGAAMLGGVAIGAIITNIAVKNIVARPRPYTHTDMPFYQWWINAGRHLESDKSFPSGHTTSAMAAMTGLFCVTDKKISWLAFLFAILMGMSRIFLFVHYPSDVLGGFIAGLIAGIISGIIVNWFYKQNEHKLFKEVIEFNIFDFLPLKNK
ncbi:MAG: phosphatase PAP2 family protein [Ruminococcus sp.]|nr:phosphatase PAP2 family protein [Candidatus Copronaster equi]